MRVHKDATPKESAYTLPPAPSKEAPPKASGGDRGADMLAMSKALSEVMTRAISQIPAPIVNVEAPVVNVPKPEVKINSPVYMTAPEVRVPATTVNVPEPKAPIVTIEPAAVTLQTNRPNKWHFTINRNEYGQMTTIDAEVG